MPDKDVATIKDLIYYQYAKIIARSAMQASDGRIAKSANYGFIRKKFMELKTGKISWSDILREDFQFVEADKECIYCEAEDGLHREHIVPKSTKVIEDCATCDKIHGIHNHIWGCKTCNSHKGTLGLYTFYRNKYPDNKKFYDLIPSLVEKKYLKTIYNCHECANTLNSGDMDGDGELTVLDLDYIFKKK